MKTGRFGKHLLGDRTAVPLPPTSYVSPGRRNPSDCGLRRVAVERTRDSGGRDGGRAAGFLQLGEGM